MHHSQLRNVMYNFRTDDHYKFQLGINNLNMQRMEDCKVVSTNA